MRDAEIFPQTSDTVLKTIVNYPYFQYLQVYHSKQIDYDLSFCLTHLLRNETLVVLKNSFWAFVENSETIFTF